MLFFFPFRQRDDESASNLQQALSLQILVGLLIDHVATRVLVLLLKKRTSLRMSTHFGTVLCTVCQSVVLSCEDSPLCLVATALMPSGISALPTLV